MLQQQKKGIQTKKQQALIFSFTVLGVFFVSFFLILSTPVYQQPQASKSTTYRPSSSSIKNVLRTTNLREAQATTQKMTGRDDVQQDQIQMAATVLPSTKNQTQDIINNTQYSNYNKLLKQAEKQQYQEQQFKRSQDDNNLQLILNNQSLEIVRQSFGIYGLDFNETGKNSSFFQAKEIIGQVTELSNIEPSYKESNSSTVQQTSEITQRKNQSEKSLDTNIEKQNNNENNQQINNYQQSKIQQEVKENQEKRIGKIAYIIMASGGDVAQTLKLLDRIYDENNYYAIHFDKKAADSQFKKFKNRIESNKKYDNNVRLLHRYIVTYQSISMVDVEISGIASLLQLGGDWQYLINLSPSHYPLYPQNYIKNILRQLPYGINLISHKRAECLKQRGEYLFLDRGLAGEHVDFSMNTGIQRPILDGYSYYKGSQWHVVTRQFCEYVVMSPDGLARRMLLYLAGYFVPDESYFQTVACNSEQFQNFTVDYDFHYVDWYNGQNVQPGKMWSPAIITNATLVQAYDSGAMFGRKFLIRDDKLGKTSIAAMDLIDQLFMEETLILGSNPESYKLSLEEKSKLVLSKLQAKINQTTMEQGCVQRWETC